jgi:hypothetical protein
VRTRYITVTLTENEAHALSSAADSVTMDFGDTPGDQWMRAAIRGRKKIRRVVFNETYTPAEWRRYLDDCYQK